MPEPFDEYKTQERRHRLLEYALLHSERVKNPRALQHLREGFNRRVLMMDASLRLVRDTVAKAGGPVLSPYAATDLAIQVNAFWLNLCGALDNLAWALQHELTVIPGATEEGGKRQKVSLFDPLFAKLIAKHSAALAAAVAEHADWNNDLRGLRDPAAHRIPIYPAPGIMTEAQAMEAESLHKAAAGLIDAGRVDEAMELIRQAGTLGTYRPLFFVAHEGRYEARPLERQLLEDDGHFAKVAHAVLSWLFRNPDRS